LDFALITTVSASMIIRPKKQKNTGSQVTIRQEDPENALYFTKALSFPAYELDRCLLRGV
jgi:hypothetical protein